MQKTEEEFLRDEGLRYEVISDSRICVTGCLSSRTQLVIPEMIAGLPVVQIGDYAFKGMKELEAALLPRTVSYLGDHAFYGCQALREFSACDDLSYVGDGVFKGCDRLERIDFHLYKNNAEALRILISNVELDLRTVLHYESNEEKERIVRLMFPAFYFDYIENYPARIFDEVVYGTGQAYRLCFKGREVDYSGYDKLLLRSTREDNETVPIWHCIGRLTTPYKLSDAARDKYRAYLSDKGSRMLALLMEKELPKLLDEVLKLDLFSKEETAKMIAQAQDKKEPEYIGLLMSYQGRRFSSESRKKRFLL